MSTNDSIFKKVEVNNQIKIIELLDSLLSKIDQITEFSESELKAISIIQNDQFLSQYLNEYRLTKKHVKRKHSKELLEALRSIANTLNQQEPDDKRWFRK